MPPRETDQLLSSGAKVTRFRDDDDSVIVPDGHSNTNNRMLEIKVTSFDESVTESLPSGGPSNNKNRKIQRCCRMWTAVFAGVTVGYVVSQGMNRVRNHRRGGSRTDVSSTAHNATTTDSSNTSSREVQSGPYRLRELHQGDNFMKHYDFYEGADSLGSAGYNTYTSYHRAQELGIFRVLHHNNDDKVVHIDSRPAEEGPRESIRLEGKTRFDSRLFLLDLDHMPTGCGQWPAFWLTDEDQWPDHGEIDIVEGVNYQRNAKTALHTSAQCSMYAHVPSYSMTGHWDRATGIPDTFTGYMDYNTSVPADNCWAMAPHQWGNQGCVVVSTQSDTLGSGLNDQNGGIYALQWDPVNRYIRSWVFPKAQGIPRNLQDAIDSAAASTSHSTAVVKPDPDTWGLPYGYFAIGDTTGCSADHFQNMRIVINTAFCGTVAGNRFFTDCPMQAQMFNVSNDPVKSCNAWIASNPTEMQDAYWTIRGVYVYEREWENPQPTPSSSP